MSQRPNILLLLTDQERYDVTTGAEPLVSTPNIDRLKSAGMNFSRAYTPISICTSARGSLLSGLYPHNHGMLNNSHENDAVRRNFPSEIPTFGTLLKEAGYDNTYTGKWHVGRDQTPEDFGFRYLGGGDEHHDSGDPQFRQYQREYGVENGGEITEAIYTDHDTNPTLIAGKTSMPKEAMRAYYLTEKTIERITECSTTDAPFFHRTDFAGPHHPYLIPEPYASMYDPDDIERWETFEETFANKPAVHELFLHYRGVADIEWETWAEIIAKYFGFVTFIDDQIGRILDAIDEHLDGENTAVIHTADHGDFVGNHRQFNKGPMMYEDTYRIPLVVRWPNVIEPGTRCDEFVRLLDLMPTFLEMADTVPPAEIDGRSLLPLFEGTPPDDWPETVFAEYHGEEFGLYSQRMVRTKRYKFVYNVPDENELYNFETDPAELHNLVNHPGYQEIRRRLETKLTEWMERTGDPLRVGYEHAKNRGLTR